MTENQKYPSFVAQYGRKPIAGVDYDPDAISCQDEYEYLTGTGDYSDDVDPIPAYDAGEIGSWK